MPTPERPRSILKISFSISLAVVAAIVTAVFVAGAPTADAAVYTLTGSCVGCNWNAPANWTPNTAFPGQGPGDTAVIGCSSSVNVNANIANGVILNFACISSTVNIPAPATNFLQIEPSSTMGSSGNTINVSGGTLNINAGPGINVGIGSSIQASAGTVNILANTAPGLSIGSGGSLSITGATVTNNGTLTVNPGGSVTLNTGQFTNNTANGFVLQSFPSAGSPGTMTWNAGIWSGGGSTLIQAGTTPGTLNMVGPIAGMILDTQVITNAGTINYTTPLAPLSINNNARIDNLGTFSLTTDIGIGTSGVGKIVNSGIFRKTGGTGVTTINAAFDNAGTVGFTLSLVGIAFNGGGTHTGIFSFFTTTTFSFNGSHAFNGGSSFAGTGNVTINGGTFMVNTSLTIPGNLTNSGNLRFGPGASTQAFPISGNYVQNAAGALDVKLNGTVPGPTGYDRVQVTGSATLNGTLNATLGFVPVDFQTWNIITDASVSGDFATKNLPTYAGGVIMEVPSPPSGTAVILQAVPLSTDISVLKTGTPSVLNGQNATYTVTVGNVGNAASVTIRDTFTGGTFVSATPTGAGVCSGTGPIDCTWASIASAGTESITVVLQANAVGTLGNTAALLSSSPADSNAANNSSTQNTTVNPAADLLISGITGLPNPVSAGQPETWSVGIGNNGPDAATSVVVNISISTGTILSASGGGFTCTNTATTANCNAASVAALANPTITVNSTAPNQPGVWTMNATVTSSTADPGPAINNGSGSVTVAGVSDLAIQKTLTGPLVAGQNAVYVINVKNFGPSDVTGVTVTDPTPPGLTFGSNSGACTTAFPCALGTLTNGQIVTITSTYAVPSNASGSISNTASVSPTATDPNLVDNSATATATVVQKADLSITKTGPASATPGSNITYTIVITNNGPSDASGVTLNDPTPAGLTFVPPTNPPCAGFPPTCTIGTLTAGSSRTIQATYTVQPSPPATIVNTAGVSSGTPDPNSANDSSSKSTSTTACPTSAPGNPAPANNATNIGTSGRLSWSDVGAAAYTVYLDVVGVGCSRFFGSTTATSLAYFGLQPGTTYEWRIEATGRGCTPKSTACMKFTTASDCPTGAPTLIAPLGGNVSGEVTFSWSAVPNAVDYKLFIDGNEAATTAATSFTKTLPNGPVTWFVVARFAAPCPDRQSQTATFTICDTTVAPLPSVVGEANSGEGYDLEWQLIPGVTSYLAEESTDANFSTNLTTQTVSTNKAHFQHSVNTTTGFYYRVSAFYACANRFGATSPTVRVVITFFTIPPSNPNVSVPAGNRQLVAVQVHVDGLAGQTLPFTARLDNKPWLVRLEPTSGIIGPDGQTFTVFIDPTKIPDPHGTFTGTVIVLVTTPDAGRFVTNGVTPISVPVSISLVTPVTPRSGGRPPANALVIPSVGHLDGINSRWVSDLRVANISSQKAKYQLTFTPDNPSKGVKQTIIDVDSGVTTALDDIIKTWYGIGSLGDSASGVLEIRPSEGSGKGSPVDEVNVSFTTVASSRTANVTANGTFGQFIPALPFSSFIGKALENQAATVLGLQQISQSNDFRTNVGVLEASGQPASVLISVFDVAGTKLLDFPLDLKGSEQRQLNSFLSQNRIALSDGRIEVKVTNGEGRVMAYASVIDNKNGSPFFVSGTALRQTTAQNYVMPGVADLNTGLAAWRSDMRIFNAGDSVQATTLTFYPQNNSGSPKTASVSINPGEVKQLNGVVSSLFGLTNSGGAIHVSTTSPSNLVVTGRTFNLTSGGSLGQFFNAVTPADGVGKGDRAMQILQAEESSRYRTNVGFSELSGKPITLEVAVVQPDSKVSPSTQITLGANEFQQFNVIRAFGLENVYNARISVKVIDGDGRLAAYGSLIDQKTEAPTYVPAQ